MLTLMGSLFPKETQQKESTMTSITNPKPTPDFLVAHEKLLGGVSGFFLFIVGLAIFQDFVESRRSGYAFYFNESLLFKTIWFLFIPILAVLYKRLRNKSLDSTIKTATFIVLPTVAHFFILPFIAVALSVLFYEGSYDLYKFFSYTLSHDLYKLVIVYSGFVLGFKLFKNGSRISPGVQESGPLKKIIINNGQNNQIVCVEDIIQITSATPYVYIHLGNKKFLHSETLKSLSQQLDNNTFVRIHKSIMVNVTKVLSFKSRLNGDYDLLLTNNDTVRLSRTYAANFKKHFKTSHRDTA